MNIVRVFVVLFVVFTGLCAATVFSSHRLSAKDYPKISEECVDCHDGKIESLVGSVHEIRVGDPKSTVSCTRCHIGDPARHMDDPESYQLTNPSDTSAVLEVEICAACHSMSHQQNMQEFNVHTENDVSCSGCHAVHTHEHSSLLKKPEPDLCIQCHMKTEGDFARSYRHPVFDGIIKCSECHLSLDETHRELSFRGIGEVCFKCHSQFQGPFPYEHQAVVYYSTEEGGCMNCHEAHGSNFPRMTKQPYEPPHFPLCSQCHSVPKHNYNEYHDTKWSGVPCNDCHVDIHGSYDNKFFLTPSLRGQGCTVVGCHSF